MESKSVFFRGSCSVSPQMRLVESSETFETIFGPRKDLSLGFIEMLDDGS